MITDAHLKMELKFHNSIILSKFDLKSEKGHNLGIKKICVNYLEICICNFKTLAFTV